TGQRVLGVEESNLRLVLRTTRSRRRAKRFHLIVVARPQTARQERGRTRTELRRAHQREGSDLRRPGQQRRGERGRRRLPDPGTCIWRVRDDGYHSVMELEKLGCGFLSDFDAVVLLRSVSNRGE